MDSEKKELKRKFDEMEEKLNFQEKKLKNEDKRCHSLHKKLQKMKTIVKRMNHQPTVNLLWCIYNYEYHKSAGRAGREHFLYSDAFESWKYGYKLRCLVALGGDGRGKGSHLSVFIQILPGTYDEILPWPFSNRIVFTLVNQTKEKDDIIIELIPSGEDEYHRPKHGPGSSRGFKKFAKLKEIEQGGYLRNDKIFMKVGVEQGD